jgi:VCBS repeat-containing protein
MATANQAIGKVFILYGKVKAVASDGTERVLGPNSVIYANERIVTEADGSVSIMLDGPPPAQIDLGRMSDVLLNEDVYAAAPPEVVKDVAADAEKIQEALEGQGEIELDATAAGGAAGTGGQDVVRFNLDGSEVTPESGAETTGIGFDTVDPLAGATGELVATAEPEPEPIEVIAYDNYNSVGYTFKAIPGTVISGENTIPVAGGYQQVKGQGNEGPERLLNAQASKWGGSESIQNASPSIVFSDNGGAVKILDTAPSDQSWTGVSTPEMTLAKGSEITFTGEISNYSQGDQFEWQLWLKTASGWELKNNGTQAAGGDDGEFQVTLEELAAGTYRLIFVANDMTNQPAATWYTVEITGIDVTYPTETIIPGTIEVEPTTVAGNILIDPNDLEGSADPEGAQDVVPEGTTLQILDPGTGEFVDVTDGTTIEGTYGTLVINADGSYEYTPYDYEQGFDGGQETFTYQLTLGDSTDTANLVIDVLYEQPDYLTIEGSPSADTLVGTDSADLIQGLEGDDQLYGAGGDDRLEGGAGADTFVVGQGDDTILDYSKADGDIVKIGVEYDDLAVVDEGGKAKLVILDGGNNPIGSVTFEGIDYTAGMDVDALKALVDIDDGTSGPA